MNEIQNNQVTIAGVVASECVFSHEVFGEKFYQMSVSVKRLSRAVDVLPVVVSERLINAETDHAGEYVCVSGQLRSFNQCGGDKPRLILSVFAREICFPAQALDSSKSNQVFLDGYVCKAPVYRRTPFGRKIADLLIAVNRPYGKSDYIPCICWGRNARFAGGFEVGDRINFQGRIQSREYEKKLDETRVEKRIAYEISVSRIKVLD